MEKYLGKITSAEFGLVKDYPFFIGLQLKINFDGSSCECGGKYTVNLHKDCKWTTAERAHACMEILDRLKEILNDAKCCNVSQLVGKPVEVTIEGNVLKDFRILTEVL